MSDTYLGLVRRDCPLPAGTHVVASARDSGGEDQERSVRQQVEVIREYCVHHHLILEQVYIDEAKTASNAENRDALNQMLSDIRGRYSQIHDRYRRDRQTRDPPPGSGPVRRGFRADNSATRPRRVQYAYRLWNHP